MPRPVMLGIVGDSGSGKTTITRGLVRVLGEGQVTHFCTDDYHRYDRRQRAERNITPLDPECNHLDILAQHLGHLKAKQPIMKPVYQHHDGTFGAPDYFEPGRFVVCEGLLGFHNRELSDSFDVRIYLDPPEELRRHWKVQRDCSRRGYTTDQVLSELDRREPDSERWIRPQRHHADIVVSFQPNDDGEDQEHLDCKLTLCDSLPHPDLTGVVNGGNGIVLTERSGAVELYVPGRAPARARLGDRGGDLGEDALRPAPARGAARRVHDRHRPPPLRLARGRPALILYHLVTARAVVALGGSSTREFDLSSLDELIAEGGQSPF